MNSAPRYKLNVCDSTVSDFVLIKHCRRLFNVSAIFSWRSSSLLLCFCSFRVMRKTWLITKHCYITAEAETHSSSTGGGGGGGGGGGRRSMTEGGVCACVCVCVCACVCVCTCCKHVWNISTWLCAFVCVWASWHRHTQHTHTHTQTIEKHWQSKTDKQNWTYYRL